MGKNMIMLYGTYIDTHSNKQIKLTPMKSYTNQFYGFRSILMMDVYVTRYSIDVGINGAVEVGVSATAEVHGQGLSMDLHLPKQE